MRRDNTHYFIYPEYFDKSLKRSEGRRLPIVDSVENPSLLEIRLAAEKLGLDYEIRESGSYPRQWWDPKGLILVEKKESKLKTIRKISFEIDKNIKPALEKKRKEVKEAKKKKTSRPKIVASMKKTQSEFRPKRRR
ncbi:MAG: signal recognition particle subunit SRP19/SEC65 family protein [Candidatus Hodarchaeales archaeon]